MIEQDTIRLLRECDAGVAMGISAIEDVLPRTADKSLRGRLSACRDSHITLKTEVQSALDRFGDKGKKPNPMAKTMSALKTNADLLLSPTDSTIAELIFDGCSMGVKSLSRYLNEYKAADESAKDVCMKLIDLEEQLAHSLRAYL